MTDNPLDNEKLIFHLAEDHGPPPTLTPAEQAEHDQWQAKSADIARTITQLVLSGHLAAESGRPRASYALAGKVTDLISQLNEEEVFGVIVYLAYNLGNHLIADNQNEILEEMKKAYEQLENVTGQDPE